MKLSTELLPQYFTIASAYNSHFRHPTNCFDFIDRDSDSLVVTVGDSWTYGSDLNPELRLNQVYGNLISSHFSADFLNLAQPGSNNFFIAERVEELGNIVFNLGYKKIYLICTFTESGRSFNSHHDVYIDYVSWFRNNSIDNFLAFLNNECYNRICDIASEHKMIFRAGTNFVDATGFCPDIDPWFRQLKIPCDITGHAGSVGANRLLAAKEFVEDRNQFKKWAIDLMNRSIYIDKVCASRTLINAHPTSQGHQIWADAILKTLT
jgi:hypothetical protein